MANSIMAYSSAVPRPAPRACRICRRPSFFAPFLPAKLRFSSLYSKKRGKRKLKAAFFSNFVSDIHVLIIFHAQTYAAQIAKEA